MKNLNNAVLPSLPTEVAVPRYDRSALRTGIVHFGVGHFHRAHQARYLDELALHHTIDAIALVRKAGGRVGYVRVAFTDEDIAAIPASSHFASVATPERREYLHADSPTTAIDERVAPESGDIIVRKTRVGAFSTTDLDQQLRAVGVDTLILAGLSTSGVVLSTVRDGADRDYRIIVLADACADPQPGVHEFLTEKVFPRQTQVTTTEELGKLLGAQD